MPISLQKPQAPVSPRHPEHACCLPLLILSSQPLTCAFCHSSEPTASSLNLPVTFLLCKLALTLRVMGPLSAPSHVTGVHHHAGQPIDNDCFFPGSHCSPGTGGEGCVPLPLIVAPSQMLALNPAWQSPTCVLSTQLTMGGSVFPVGDLSRDLSSPSHSPLLT